MKKEITKQMLLDAHDADGVVSSGKLNEVKIIKTKRPNGTLRIQQNFDACPSLAEQHTAHLTNINYLMEKYKPDELAAYLAARNQYRQEILGHDFSQEPNLQEANNIVYRSRQEFENLPDDVRLHFANHLEFLKFIDNPANEEKMLKLGILTRKQVDAIKIKDENPNPTPPPTPTTQEEKETKK